MDLFGFFGKQSNRRRVPGRRPGQANPLGYIELTPQWWTSRTHVLLDMDGTLISQPGALFHQLFTVFALLRLAPLGDLKTLLRAVRETKNILLSEHGFASNRDAFFETLAQELQVTRAKVERFAQRFFDSDYPFICLILGADESARVALWSQRARSLPYGANEHGPCSSVPPSTRFALLRPRARA